MTFKIHDTGYRAIASILAGTGKKIDAMRIELDTPGDADGGGASESPYKKATVPVRGAATGGVVTFTALVRANDFGPDAAGGKITRATVMCGEVPVASSLIVPPVELSASAYTTVTVDLKFCD